MKSPNGYRILYAEENEDTRLMLRMMCEYSGIEPVTAGTVAEAWRLAQAEQFDLFMLDSRFPDGDGLDLCRRLREYAPRAPILIYSGDAFEMDKQNGLAAGADDYLTKPYLEDLTEVIRQRIEQTRKSSPESERVSV